MVEKPVSNELFRYIGSVLVFDDVQKNYDLNIYAAGHLPHPLYVNVSNSIAITEGAQSSNSPSLQEMILESGVSINYDIVKLPLLEKTITKDYSEAENYVARFVSGLRFHYSNIFKSLEKETGTPFQREHLFFIANYEIESLRKSSALFKFGPEGMIFNVNAMLVKALDEYFLSK